MSCTVNGSLQKDRGWGVEGGGWGGGEGGFGQCLGERRAFGASLGVQAMGLDARLRLGKKVQ